ncbi:hypothetical protein HMPREF3217_00174, partial [Finegoldia magna]
MLDEASKGKKCLKGKGKGNNLRKANGYKINIKELYYEKKIFIVNVSISDDGWCIHP